MTVWRNWARTQRCRPVRVELPRGDRAIRGVLADAARQGVPVKVVGAGHSFTDIACTDGVLVSLERHDAVLDIDRAARTVTVQAGITLSRLNEVLAANGLALENLGDIAYQSVAGAISTGTHGTGARFGNLGTLVQELTLVLADGSTLRCSADTDPDTFRAAQVSLGALGVISTVTLRCREAFTLEAHEGTAHLDDVLSDLDREVDAHEHFEFFWFPHTQLVYVKRNDPTDAPPRPPSGWETFRDRILFENLAFGAATTAGRLRPELIPWIARNVVTSQLDMRAHRVDRSDRIFTSPRLVRFTEMEYAIPRASAAEAIRRVQALIDERGLRVNFPVEVRFVAADDILLSPSHARETCYIAVHVSRGMPHGAYFRGVEEIMRSYDGRPHWGKLHHRTADDLRDAYPRWDDFRRVRAELDPTGRFRNGYLDRVLGPV